MDGTRSTHEAAVGRDPPQAAALRALPPRERAAAIAAMLAELARRVPCPGPDGGARK